MHNYRTWLEWFIVAQLICRIFFALAISRDLPHNQRIVKGSNYCQQHVSMASAHSCVFLYASKFGALEIRTSSNAICRPVIIRISYIVPCSYHWKKNHNITHITITSVESVFHKRRFVVGKGGYPQAKYPHHIMFASSYGCCACVCVHFSVADVPYIVWIMNTHTSNAQN